MTTAKFKIPDSGPSKDPDSYKQAAIFVARKLREMKPTMNEDEWRMCQRFWSYIEADAFLPPRLIA